MPHFLTLFLFITSISLNTWTVATLILYVQSRKHLLAWESMVGGSLMIITTGMLIKHYARSCGVDPGYLPSYISSVGIFVCLFSLTFFTHMLSGIKITRLRQSFFIGVAICFSLLLLFMPENREFGIAGPFAVTVSDGIAKAALIIYTVLFYGTLGYCFIVGLLTAKSIGDPVLKKLYFITFGTCLVFLVPVIFFSITGLVTVATFAICGMFIALATENVYCSICFSSQPSYFSNGELTSTFVDRFQITDRERQIVTFLLDGKANKEIADALFISPRTVENHLSNIYQKTTVKTRLQLINLIRANAGK